MDPIYLVFILAVVGMLCLAAVAIYGYSRMCAMQREALDSTLAGTSPEAMAFVEDRRRQPDPVQRGPVRKREWD